MIRENFTFFQKNNIFKFGIQFLDQVAEKKKIATKIYNFFSRTPKLQNKEIRNKQNFEEKISQNILFRKHQIQKKFAKRF